jgi:membrane protein YqaA with SNARE-associated domain
MSATIRERTLALARSPHAEWALFGLSFAESSFFPLPPDLLLGPMAAAEPRKWARYALVCTVASVLGGTLGYAIGYFLREWLLQFEIFQHQLDGFEEAFSCWGLWIILIKGLTPIPYKLVTIASGMALFNLPIFIGASLVTRGVRFFLVAWLFQRFGPQIAPVLEKRLGLVLLGVAVFIVLAVVAMQFMHALDTCPTWLS